MPAPSCEEPVSKVEEESQYDDVKKSDASCAAPHAGCRVTPAAEEEIPEEPTGQTPGQSLPEGAAAEPA